MKGERSFIKMKNTEIYDVDDMIFENSKTVYSER